MKRSSNSLTGYSIGATDGEIGKVTAFYFDDENWTIRYLTVETGIWFFNKKVLIAPQSLQMPDWSGKNFRLTSPKNK